MDVNHDDCEEYFDVKPITLHNSVTSAGTGDATEVEGAMIDVDPYTSGFITVHAQTNLTADKTLTIAINVDSAATNTNTGTVTDVVVAAATVIATGADSSVETAYVFPVPGSLLKRGTTLRYVHFDITPDCNQTNGADNVNWGATFTGIKREMS